MRVLIKQCIYILMTCALVSCANSESDAENCTAGYKLASDGKYDDSIPLLNRCIESSKTTPDKKRYAYIARAWVRYNLQDITSAVADQESAFNIRNASNYKELINYALYLRLAGRIAESMDPLIKAEAIDKAKGKVTMMTQYQLGWTLQELGKHKEAIEVFKRGIPAQPDYPFVYLRLGMSLDALGRKKEARNDLSKGLALAKQNNEDMSANELTSIRDKLKEYGLL